MLSTAGPVKFPEALTNALSTLQNFDFERDVLAQGFRGLLKKEKRVVGLGTKERAGQIDDRKHGR